MSTRSILRRPVGGANAQQSTKAASISSASSVYSGSPGLSRSESSSTKDSLRGVDSESGRTPAIPPKDSQRQHLPQTPKSSLASPACGSGTSPPRPEIWKRRSVKSDRSIVVPELKLQQTNGSTPSPPQQPRLERQLPDVPSRLPRSLQGRKPVPSRPAPPQLDLGGMGNKLSKLKEKKGVSAESSEDVQPEVLSTINRLPTPEYLKSDKQVQPMAPQVLSPAAPETPPNEVPPVVPQKSNSRSTSAHTLVPETVLADTVNRPNLLTSHSRDSSETLTITSELKVMRSPQPKKAYAAKILTPQPSPPLEANKKSLPAALPSSTTNPNIRFPRPSTPASPGTVFQGPELGIVHFECYQNHKLMRSSRNTSCPTACMICRKSEMGPRWRCTWCCLSACGACMQVLTSIPRKDLRMCLDRVAQKVHHQSQRSSGRNSSTA